MTQMPWKTKRLLGPVAVLLLALALVVGCGEEAPNTPLTLLEGTQSATRIQALETVTLRVTARDAGSRSLRFSWEASAGTLGSPSETATTSEVTWTAPACSARGTGDATVSGGGNSHGQLGDGTILQRSTPAQVPELTGVTALAVGGSHCLALRQDGTVWAGGYNLHGQLGDGTTTSRTLPFQVPGLSGVTALSASSSHSLAIRENGGLWAWGQNAQGALGDGTTATRLTPVQVSARPGLTAVAAGSSHSLALLSGGTVLAWGSNSAGQVGDGTVASNPIPGPVSLP